MTGFISSAILILIYPLSILSKTLDTTTILPVPEDDGFENNIIDFDDEYTVKFNNKYGQVPWHANDYIKNTHKYTLINDNNKNNTSIVNSNQNDTQSNKEETTTEDFKVIPLELISTTEDPIISIMESTTEPDLTVIPLSTTVKLPNFTIKQTVTLPTTNEYDTTTDIIKTTTNIEGNEVSTNLFEDLTTTWEPLHFKTNNNNITTNSKTAVNENNNTASNKNNTVDLNKVFLPNRTDSTSNKSSISRESKEYDPDVPIFTELDTEDLKDAPEDYYDSKDVLPTSTPKTDAISVLFGLAGSVVESVVESVAEKVVPKSIYDLFKRMQKQNEALEAERLRSREENGGIGQFGRGILKSLSTGLSKPLSQLMAGGNEAGSLDTDRGFLGNVASSVTSVANAANTYLEAFKDKVQAIYPGTVWCGDGHSAQARSSSDLGLFFFTDTCCRQHDACKMYIKAGETKYGLTNTGLFTRSHCSCDLKFRDCLRRTNSLVSAQIGLTYFNVLGPQCFRRAHPIVKCNRRTRITGQKCEEYELDYTKPKMWQWFDNETF